MIDRMTLDRIAYQVAVEADVSVAALRQRTKAPEICHPRQEAMRRQREAGARVVEIMDFWGMSNFAVRWGIDAAADRHQRGCSLNGCLKVRVRNQEFASAKLAALHFGLRPATVSTMVELGRADLIGTGTRRAGRPNLHRAKAVKLGPFEWSSHRAAAKDLGLSSSWFSRSLRQGRADLVLPYAMRLAGKSEAQHAKQVAAMRHVELHEVDHA